MANDNQGPPQRAASKPPGCSNAVTTIIVILVLILLVAVALPNFVHRCKHPEAEVKQNCHAIQLALERYAVDHPDGLYPVRLMGGDWTDTQVVWESWVLSHCKTGDIEEMLQTITNPERHDKWEPAAQDMGDALVMEGYMPKYPGNPFISQRRRNQTLKLHHYPGSVYPGHAPWWRYVGGRNSDKMYEVFGPTFTGGPEMCSNAGDIYVHHIFNKPPYKYEADEWKVPPGGWSSPSGNKFLQGNFSYFPRLDVGESFYMNAEPKVTGYTISGYGSLRTAGQDVYNRNGNYKGRYRTESCINDCDESGGLIPYPTDIPCLCGSGAAPSREQNNGGSDTIPDGVVVTLDSGVDKKAVRVTADGG